MTAIPEQAHHRRAAEVVIQQGFGWRWALAAAAAVGGIFLFVYALVVLFVRGVGIWGTNIPYVWAFDIINYVWWIGLANASSLVAASLTLRKAPWRTSINRFAEATAFFAVVCAGLFPILHLGRPELFYWIFPYPSPFGVWPQFRSPLVWDFWAILTHLVVTTLFWFVGLIPDFAHLRDRARRRWLKLAFGILAFGWRNSARHWANHQRAYHTLAGLIVVLVIFMQSTVSFEFAVTLVPQWHQTSYPAYFVVSGLISGIGMMLVLAVLMRHLLDLRAVITERHLATMAVLLIANAVVMAWSYGGEALSAWYAGIDGRQGLADRIGGRYAALYWGALVCTVLVPQILWFRRLRRHALALILAGVSVNVGILLDRFMVVVGGMARPHIPSMWRDYSPTGWEWPLLIGSIGLFSLLMLLFVRFVPVIPLFERRAEGATGGDGR